MMFQRYEESFLDLIEFEDSRLTDLDCEKFLVFLDKMISRHANVVETMAAVRLLLALSYT